jgi:hypothetical protein
VSVFAGFDEYVEKLSSSAELTVFKKHQCFVLSSAELDNFSGHLYLL